MTDFQKNLVFYREKKGLSQEKAANLLGISTAQLENYEQGEQSPTADEIVAIANLYGIKIKQLFKKRNSYTSFIVKKRKLVGFNRYGMNQGFAIVAVPIVAFFALALMFVPAFSVSQGKISLMQILFLTGRTDYIVFGCYIFAVMAFNIIYWSILLSLGPYARAKHKVLSNVVLSIFSIATFVICLSNALLFRKIMSFWAYVCDGAIFVCAITQLVLLIVMNLEGGENAHQHIYTYHETNESGYDTRHWYTLGITAFSIAALCLMFTVSYRGNVMLLWGSSATMIEMMFGSKIPLCLIFGIICVSVLVFNIVYYVVICTLPRELRRKTAKANNVLITIMSIVLLIDTLAFMSYFEYQISTLSSLNNVLPTDTCIALYLMLFVTAVYGLITLPIINSKKKRFYIRDKNGIRKVKRIEGMKPGKILAYKLPTMAQILICLMLGCALGLSFLDDGLGYVAFMSGGALVLELVSIILQFHGRYVSVGAFAYSIILNTLISVFAVFLLMLAIFGSLNLGARIAMPIVAGFLLLFYASFAFFVKPIRDTESEL